MVNIGEPKMPTLVPDKKIEKYEEDASRRAKEKNTLMQNMLGGGLDKKDIIVADAEEENKYRELLKNGTINKEELECLTTINLTQNKTYTAVTFEGVIRGEQVKASRDVDDDGFTWIFKAKVNAQVLDEKAAEILFNQLEEELKKRNTILEKIKQRAEIETPEKN